MVIKTACTGARPAVNKDGVPTRLAEDDVLLAWKQLRPVRESRTILPIRTVIETPTFQKQADAIWSEDERLDFVTWIAQNPLAGDVIPGANGARKVRWAAQAKGKRGGVRVIYFNLAAQAVICLIAIYAKSDQSNIQPNDIRRAAQ